MQPQPQPHSCGWARCFHQLSPLGHVGQSSGSVGVFACMSVCVYVCAIKKPTFGGQKKFLSKVILLIFACNDTIVAISVLMMFGVFQLYRFLKPTVDNGGVRRGWSVAKS